MLGFVKYVVLSLLLLGSGVYGKPLSGDVQCANLGTIKADVKRECNEKYKDDPNCLGIECKVMQCYNGLQRCRCEHWLEAQVVCEAGSCECARGKSLDQTLCETNPVGSACSAECKCPPITHVDSAACSDKCNRCRNNAIASCFDKVQDRFHTCMEESAKNCSKATRAADVGKGLCDVTMGYMECVAKNVPSRPTSPSKEPKLEGSPAVIPTMPTGVP